MRTVPMPKKDTAIVGETHITRLADQPNLESVVSKLPDGVSRSALTRRGKQDNTRLRQMPAAVRVKIGGSAE